MLVTKGGYALESLYDIVQHEYAGGGYAGCGGYIEVLEIKNPPEDRQSIVIYEYNSGLGAQFSEWEDLEFALAAYKRYWGSPERTRAAFPQLPGFIRILDRCDTLPWFYAKAGDRTPGDYVAPPGWLF